MSPRNFNSIPIKNLPGPDSLSPALAHKDSVFLSCLLLSQLKGVCSPVLCTSLRGFCPYEVPAGIGAQPLSPCRASGQHRTPCSPWDPSPCCFFQKEGAAWALALPGHWWGYEDGTCLPCCPEPGAASPSAAGRTLLPAQHSGWHRSHLSTSPATTAAPGINHGKGIERRKMGIFNK